MKWLISVSQTTDIPTAIHSIPSVSVLTISVLLYSFHSRACSPLPNNPSIRSASTSGLVVLQYPTTWVMMLKLSAPQ